MRVKAVRRLPIVAAQRGLVGNITADDIVDLSAEEMTALTKMVSREPRPEAKLRT